MELIKLSAKILSAIILMQSCCSHQIDRRLQIAEQLMSENPDSSLSILSSIKMDAVSGRGQRAKYALLLSMARDKNYIDVTDDSLAKVAYDYYKKHGSGKDRMLSSYYLGVVHQNAGNYTGSAIEFDETLTLAQSLQDNHQCGLACRHLSTLYHNTFNYYLALQYAKMTVEYFDACNEKLSADYGRVNVAGNLIKTHGYGEALAVLDEVISTNDYAPLLKYAYWLKAEALIYGEHDYAGALNALENVPVSRSSEAVTLYGFKALASEATGKSADADYYMSLSERQMRTPVDTLTCLDHRSRIYEMRGDFKKALECFSTAMNIQNRQVLVLLEQSVTSAMEDHYRQSLKEEKERSYLKTIVFIFCGIVGVIVLAILVYIIRKQRQGRLQDMADIEELNKDIQLFKQRNNQFKRVSDIVIKDRVQSLQRLSDAYFEWTDDEVRKREVINGRETKDEIIARFRHKLGELRADRQLFASVEEAVNLSMDNIVARAREVCGDMLKEEDYRTLTLLYSGLSIKSVAFLLRTSEPALRTRKTRYKKFFETLDQPYSSLLTDALDSAREKRWT